jgi:hypothetical protein
VADAWRRPLWLRVRSRRTIALLEQAFWAGVAADDPPAALGALTTLVDRYGWHQPAETLLFRRARRPADPATRAALFRGIAHGPVFREHHRAYAAVSLAYLAVEERDTALAQETAALLTQAVARLEVDPALLRCRRRNRENRFKRLISSQAALLHLHLLLRQPQGLVVIAQRSHGLVARLDFDRLPADVVLRAMSNFARCLALQGAIGHPLGLRNDLVLLLEEASRPRHLYSQALEDHRWFLASMLAGLEASPARPGAAAAAGSAPPPLPAYALAILNVERPEARDDLLSCWQAVQAGSTGGSPWPGS